MQSRAEMSQDLSLHQKALGYNQTAAIVLAEDSKSIGVKPTRKAMPQHVARAALKAEPVRLI